MIPQKVLLKSIVPAKLPICVAFPEADIAKAVS